MNFYKRYMGDYGKKTAHLSLMEHGAYTLLLDAFYSTEKGLPASHQELFRICRAMTKPEQAAVASVADQFFPVSDDGLRYNVRANEELADAEPAMSAARENGKRGGRPKNKTQEKPTGFSIGTQEEPISKPPQSQKPDSPSLRSGERATRLPADWELPPEYRTFCRDERPELDPEKVAAKFADYWHGKGGKEGRKLDWLATWRNWVRDEKAPYGSRRQVETDGHWTDSRSGVEGKARELGLTPWDELNEQWPLFLGRVKRAAEGQTFTLDKLGQLAKERTSA